MKREEGGWEKKGIRGLVKKGKKGGVINRQEMIRRVQ